MAAGGIGRCVVLAGGTGGAKLAAGLQDVLGAGLSVVVNTGDDIEIAGVDVSPDPDLVTYWLSGEIDEERGWGIKDDSFTVFDRLVQLGTPDWFRLSDRDLATCLYRKEFIAEGGRRTDAQAQIARALGVRGHGPADVRGAGPHSRQDRRGLAGPPAVPGRRARAGAGRGGRDRGSRGGHPHAGGARGDRGMPRRS